MTFIFDCPRAKRVQVPQILINVKRVIAFSNKFLLLTPFLASAIDVIESFVSIYKEKLIF
jgi:hypothetical protein